MYVFAAGSSPDVGVPDMTVISDIDEKGINKNLKVRYDRNQIYVSFSIVLHIHETVLVRSGNCK